MIELVVSLSSSQHRSHNLGKKGDNGRLGRKNVKQGEIKLEYEKGQNWLDQRLKSTLHQATIARPESSPQRYWAWKRRKNL